VPVPTNIRIGIVGCGNLVRQVHLPTLNTLPGVSITALADPFQNSLEACASIAPSARCFPSLEDLLESQSVDAVLVASPSGEHARHANLVLHAQKALYLEKPMAASLEEALSLQPLQSAAVAMMGFNYRFNPLLRHIAEDLRRQPATHIESVFSTPPRPLPTWKSSRATGGGALLDLGAHHLDILTGLFGFDLTVQSATLTSKHSEHDSAALTLQANNGPTIESLFSLCTSDADSFTLTSPASRRHFSRYNPLSFPLFPPIQFAAYQWQRLRSPWKEPSFALSLAAWIEAIRRDTPPPVTLADGLRVARLIHDAESLANPA
jgi:predicted dehydrogenase